jgi:hypothetical protein
MSNQMPGDWRTPKQRAEYEAYAHREREKQRELCGALQFWRGCKLRRCKRRHACAGEPYDCFSRSFRAMAEDLKVWIRAAATAAKSGLPLPEVHRIANAERERYVAQLEQAVLAAEAAASADDAPPPPADPAPSAATAAHDAPAAPRVRSL